MTSLNNIIIGSEDVDNILQAICVLIVVLCLQNIIESLFYAPGTTLRSRNVVIWGVMRGQASIHSMFKDLFALIFPGKYLARTGQENKKVARRSVSIAYIARVLMVIFEIIAIFSAMTMRRSRELRGEVPQIKLLSELRNHTSMGETCYYKQLGPSYFEPIRTPAICIVLLDNLSSDRTYVSADLDIASSEVKVTWTTQNPRLGRRVFIRSNFDGPGDAGNALLFNASIDNEDFIVTQISQMAAYALGAPKDLPCDTVQNKRAHCEINLEGIETVNSNLNLSEFRDVLFRIMDIEMTPGAHTLRNGGVFKDSDGITYAIDETKNVGSIPSMISATLALLVNWLLPLLRGEQLTENMLAAVKQTFGFHPLEESRLLPNLEIPFSATPGEGYIGLQKASSQSGQTSPKYVTESKDGVSLDF